MTLQPNQVKHNAFSQDLKDDYIAVSDDGSIIARADEATIRRDHPTANLFTGKDFGKDAVPQPAEPEHPFTPPIPGVPTTPSGLPVADALADDPTPEPKTRTHPLDDGTPYEGPDAIEPTDPRLNQIAAAGGTPIKDALAASHAAAKETTDAGQEPKIDDLQAAQAKALEDDGVLSDDKTPNDPNRPARKHTAAEDTTKTANSLKPGKADGSAFDHDGVNGPGGSKKGAESTAHKGAEKREAAATK